MKCKVCGNKTNYDVSYGYDEYIVCDACFDKLRKAPLNSESALTLIFRMGIIRREMKKKSDLT